MTTLLISHSACFNHDPGRGHPESPGRLKAILDTLDRPAFARLERREAPRAEKESLAMVHDADYVDHVLASVPKIGHSRLDADTVLSDGSGEGALRAAGAVVAAVDAVMAGTVRNAFCAVRPPGHHAESATAMGFCLFNNVAVGAAHARARHGCRRVAVVDFDVHHGNGTQSMFERDPDLFFASTHQFPLYPGTGRAEERGLGNIVNAPLAPQSGSVEFRQAMTRTVLPALRKFAPDFLLISAGFDAHEADPLASLRLHEDDYIWASAALAEIAAECAGGRLVSTLEGGYNLNALAASAAAHVETLMAA